MRKHAKIKCALQGPSGSGKTMSALLIAFGLCGDWEKITIIDTENSSSDLYAHMGSYNVLPLLPPFTPEKYIQAIKECEKDAEVIIVDSLSHEWEGSGGVLDTHSQMVGNSFTNWSKLTPRHNFFLQAIIQSPCHLIGTLRSKQDYVLNEKNGKMVPEKVGLKGIQREGMDYEFTLVFDLDIKHQATASKDRTELFIDKPSFVISEQTGKTILDWCHAGVAVSPEVKEAVKGLSSDEFIQRINSCISVPELMTLFEQTTESHSYKEHFTKRRKELIGQNGLSINNP